MQLWWRRHLDIALFLQFPRQRLNHRLADLDPATRQVPATHVAMIDQKDAPLLVDHEPPHPERHDARKAPIGMQDALQRQHRNRNSVTSHGNLASVVTWNVKP